MSATIHQLPPVKRGRVRKSQSMDAAGDCSLILLNREGEAAPENVIRFRDKVKREVPKPSPELSFISAILATMTVGQLSDVAHNLKRAAQQGDEPARLAHNLIDRALNP